MKKVIPIVLLLIASSLISSAQSRTPTVDDPDAYAVYDAVIADGWAVEAARARKLIIDLETTDYPDFAGGETESCLKPEPGEEARLGPLVKAYKDANKNTPSLQRKFKSAWEYELVPRESINALFKGKGEEGWKDFYAKYPDSGGSIHLSAVGFNADKTLALVYVGYWCGDICGEGAYYYLKKTDGKWSDIRWPGIQCHWVS